MCNVLFHVPHQVSKRWGRWNKFSRANPHLQNRGATLGSMCTMLPERVFRVDCWCKTLEPPISREQWNRHKTHRRTQTYRQMESDLSKSQFFTGYQWSRSAVSVCLSVCLSVNSDSNFFEPNDLGLAWRFTWIQSRSTSTILGQRW